MYVKHWQARYQVELFLHKWQSISKNDSLFEMVSLFFFCDTEQISQKEMIFFSCQCFMSGNN
jgi:hypothetical protein